MGWGSRFHRFGRGTVCNVLILGTFGALLAGQQDKMITIWTCKRVETLLTGLPSWWNTQTQLIIKTMCVLPCLIFVVFSLCRENDLPPDKTRHAQATKPLLIIQRLEWEVTKHAPGAYNPATTEPKDLCSMLGLFTAFSFMRCRWGGGESRNAQAASNSLVLLGALFFFIAYRWQVKGMRTTCRAKAALL